MTEDEARSALLSLDGSVEAEHHGHPDFRVRNKIFATLWPGRDRSVLRLPLPIAIALEQENGDRHRVVSSRGEWGWLDVRLSSIDSDEFLELAAEAHSHLAIGKEKIVVTEVGEAGAAT